MRASSSFFFDFVFFVFFGAGAVLRSRVIVVVVIVSVAVEFAHRWVFLSLARFFNQSELTLGSVSPGSTTGKPSVMLCVMRLTGPRTGKAW